METVHKHGKMVGFLIPTVPDLPTSKYRSSTYFVAVCTSSSALRENARFSRHVLFELICPTKDSHVCPVCTTVGFTII